MPNPRDPKNEETDPYIYANILNGFMQDRNPLQNMWGDLGRMAQFMANLGKNRKMAQERIEKLNAQRAKVEQDMATVNPTQIGTRLNKLR